MVSKIGGAAVPFVVISLVNSLLTTKIAGRVESWTGNSESTSGIFAAQEVFLGDKAVQSFVYPAGGSGAGYRLVHVNKPRTSVASATRPTARIMAPARGGP